MSRRFFFRSAKYRSANLQLLHMRLNMWQMRTIMDMARTELRLF